MTGMYHRGVVLAVVVGCAIVPAPAVTVLDADFDIDENGFTYLDDTFRGSSEPSYASGVRVDPGGFAGGGLSVSLAGLDGDDIDDMSGGWRRTFSLATSEDLEVTFRYNLTQSNAYEDDELSQVMVSVDGTLYGTGGADFVAEIEGDGGGGGTRTTDWRLFRVGIGTLGPGAHTITIGGYNNRKTEAIELTDVLIDDVRIATPEPVTPNLFAAALVDDLDPVRFRQNVETLAAFGTRFWEQQGNLDAGDWIEAELQSYGYATERHTYTFSGQQRDNIYATKIGTVNPDRMYIVSGHMDSFNTQSSGGAFAPGADDDASGTSLVLEAARVFAPATVETETSIRFILWNNEETGLDGSEEYVVDRRPLQGIENPPGSGSYPEPIWLGVIQHDMILFDHGLPVQPEQIPEADIDIEYQSSAFFVGDAIELATAVHAANVSYATDYPAEVSADMNFTDSKSFQGWCPAISVRENRRVAEIGNGANPNWHKDSDVVATYSELDFLFGFNVVQTTTGALAELAGATIVVCGDGLVPPGEGCDDGDTVPGDGCDSSCNVEPDYLCAGQPSVCAICRTDNLRFPVAGDVTTISWDAPASTVCPVRYDVARGGLVSLRSSGNFAAAACLADDIATPQLQDDAPLPPGSGFWYLSRVDGESWNDALGSGAGVRDGTLSACP